VGHALGWKPQITAALFIVLLRHVDGASKPIKAAGCSSPTTQATAGIPLYAPSCRQVLPVVCAVGVCYFARAIDGR
jgi:hypothetical protein